MAIIESGNFQEGSNPISSTTSAHNFQESGAHNRGQSLKPYNIAASFSYSGGWRDTLNLNAGPPLSGPEVQDYNFVLVGNNATPSTNPIITGVPLVIGAQLLNWNTTGGSSTEYSYQNGYYFYVGGSGTSGGPTAAYDWQDLLPPGTYSMTISKSISTLDTTKGAPVGTVNIYANSGVEKILLRSLSPSSSGATISFNSVSSFGSACPFRIYAEQVGMGGHYENFTWGEGYFTNYWVFAADEDPPYDANLYSCISGFTLSGTNGSGAVWTGSGPNSGVPSQGINWEVYCNSVLTDLFWDGSSTAGHAAGVGGGSISNETATRTFMQYLSALQSGWPSTPIPLSYPTTPNPPFDGSVPCFISSTTIPFTGTGAEFNGVPAGWAGPSFTWTISGTRTGP